MASTKDTKKSFRPTLFVQHINQTVDHDPDFEYKNIIFTYKHDPNRVQRYLDAGWEIVETTQPTMDDRSFTPNSKEEKLRPQPLVTTTRDGYQQVLMRCSKVRRRENELAKKMANDEAAMAMVRKRGGTVTKRGNEIITTEAEVNETNI